MKKIIIIFTLILIVLSVTSLAEQKVSVLVKLNDPVNLNNLELSTKKSIINSNQNVAIKSIKKIGLSIKKQYKTFNTIYVSISTSKLDQLRNNPYVENILIDSPVYAHLDESAVLTNASISWVWNTTLNLTGSGRTVCVLDSGMNYTNINLDGCTQYDFYSGNCTRIKGGFSWCNNTACTQNDPDPMDNDDHGTHTAGIIGSNDTTYKGIAPNEWKQQTQK